MVALFRLHIIISWVFKFGVSSLTQNLFGHRVWKLVFIYLIYIYLKCPLRLTWAFTVLTFPAFSCVPVRFSCHWKILQGWHYKIDFNCIISMWPRQEVYALDMGILRQRLVLCGLNMYPISLQWLKSKKEYNRTLDPKPRLIFYRVRNCLESD
jgi:hypothetical protein